MLPDSGIIINVFFVCDGRYLSAYKCDIKGEGKYSPPFFAHILDFLRKNCYSGYKQDFKYVLNILYFYKLYPKQHLI